MRNGYLFILLALCVVLGAYGEIYSTEVDFVSEGLVYKTTTSTTTTLNLGIHDEIERQINQINQDRELEQAQRKGKINEIKDNARKEGFELTIKDEKIVDVKKIDPI